MTLEAPRLLFLFVPALLIVVSAALLARGIGIPRVLRMILRLSVLGLLVWTLAGPFVPALKTTTGETLVLFDVSSSVHGSFLEEGKAWMNRLIQEKQLSSVPVLAFAGEALLTPEPPILDGALPQPEQRDVSLLTPPLELAAAKAQNPATASIVLVTDGLARDREKALKKAREQGLPIHIVHPRIGALDAAVQEVRLPRKAQAGAPFAIEARISIARAQGPQDPQNVPITATLEVEGVVVASKEVGQLSNPEVRFENLTLPEGSHEIRIRIDAPGDMDDRNDTLGGTLPILGQPRILLVGGAGRSGSIEEGLAIQDIVLERKPDLSTFNSADDLGRYSAMILGPDIANLPLADQTLVRDFIIDQGGGLLVVASGGPGGMRHQEDSILEPFLPVTLPDPVDLAAAPPSDDLPPDPDEEETPPDPENEKADEPGDDPGNDPGKKPDPPLIDASKPVARRILGSALSLVLILDTSGSMTGGKLDAARAAALATAGTLQPEDRLGVLAFSEEPQWILPLTTVADVDRLENRLSGLSSLGKTRFFPVLTEARNALLAESAGVRHIIFLTDGESEEFKDFRSLILSMQKRGITLTTVGLGEMFNARRLGQFAEWGAGSFYSVYDFQQIPQIYHLEVGKVLDNAASFRAPEAALPREKQNDPISNPAVTKATTDDPTRKPKGPNDLDQETSKAKAPPSKDPKEATDADKTPSTARQEPILPPAQGRGLPVTANGNSPFLAGIPLDEIPPIHQPLKTESRFSAWVPLLVEGKTPLFSYWMAGLGRVAVLSAAVGSPENPEWAQWPRLPQFLAQTTRFLLRSEGDLPPSAQTRITAGEELTVLLPDLTLLGQMAEATGGSCSTDFPHPLPNRVQDEEEKGDRSFPYLLLGLCLLPLDLALGRMDRDPGSRSKRR